MPLQLLRPTPARAQWPERLLACLGAAVCIALTIFLSPQLAPGVAGLPAIVAPVGASAVLVFAVPASPLAQPWPVVGGNMVSALVGVTAFRLCPDPTMAAGLAAGAAILLMSLLRCLHPPGGAAELTAVIGGPAVHAAGFGFPFFPVTLNSVALVTLAAAFHKITGHSYPHRPAVPARDAAALRSAAGFRPEDADAALAETHESFDISREDLELLLAKAELHARQRHGS